MSGIVGSRLNIRGSGLVGSLGTDGQVFTSAGAGLGAVYEDAAGGGKIVQIKITTGINTTYYTSSTSWQTNTNYNVTITPTSASNEILIFCNPGRASGANYYASFSFHRAISGGASTDNFVGTTYGTNWGEGSSAHPWSYKPLHMSTIDTTHNATSAITYTAQTKAGNNGNAYFGGGGHAGIMYAMEMEIA
jgi:hypothetical protein